MPFVPKRADRKPNVTYTCDLCFVTRFSSRSTSTTYLTANKTTIALTLTFHYHNDMTSTRHHNIYIDGAVCFWTSSIVDWLPVLKSRKACETVLRILDECRKHYGVKLLAYVLMPDHIHLAIWADRAVDAQTFVKLFLRKSATAIADLADSAARRGNPTSMEWLDRFRARARQGARVRIWKERGRAFPVTQIDGVRQKIDYIHQNPVRRGLVATAEEWEFSSVSWYEGGKSLIAIDEFDW